MAVLRESPWYQEISKEGEQRGKELGRIEMALEIKFREEGLQLMSEIADISDLDKLKAIQHGIMTLNTLDEVRTLIQNVKFT